MGVKGREKAKEVVVDWKGGIQGEEGKGRMLSRGKR